MFHYIGFSEAFRCDIDSRLSLPGYHPLLSRCRLNERGGGVGIFVRNEIQFKIREDLSIFLPHVFESIFLETESKTKNTIIGVIYRPNTLPRADLNLFYSTIFGHYQQRK